MVLGVDAGGTSTRAVLVDRTGRCLGYGVAGGGNPVSWGPERAAQAIAAAVSAALAQAHGGDGSTTGPGSAAPSIGTERQEIPVVLAMAGGSAFSDTGPISVQLRSLGVDCDLVVASDLLAMFCAGTPELDGYAMVAGTGAAAVRVRDGQVEVSADGLGWLLGDAGSGFWIGHRVVRAALAGLDGRGPATGLTPMVLDELGIRDDGRRDASGRPAALQAAVDVLYRWRPVEMSRFAAAAFRAGEDPVAVAILAAARERLVAVLGAVRTGDLAGPVVLGGGIARRLPGLAEAITNSAGGDRQASTAPHDGEDRVGQPAPAVITVTDGTVGAGVLALRRAGIAVDRAMFDLLAASLADRRDDVART